MRYESVKGWRWIWLALVLGVLAGVFPAYAQTWDGPNSCLVVANERSDGDVKVVIHFPQGYEDGYWMVERHSQDSRGIVMAKNNAALHSPNGRWSLSVTPQSGESMLSWQYEAGVDEGQDCNGVWILTVR